MRRLPIRLGRIAVVVAALASSPVWAADFNFNHLVSNIEQRYQVRHDRIPFLGFVSFCARIVTHDGVHGLHLAQFEDVGNRVPSDDFDTFVRGQLGETWNVIVRTHEKATNEDTIIYARADGGRFVLLIAQLEGKELSLVKIGVDPDRLPRWLNEHEHHETL